MKDLNHFYNDGFGWVCKACERQSKTPDEPHAHSRLLREGEAEDKRAPRFSNSALARWADAARTTLVCPRCRATEALQKP